MNKRKIIQRIIILPAMVLVYLIPVIILYFKYLKAFFLYGGEMVTYFSKSEVESVQQLYYRLMQESGQREPVLGKDLEFISQIKRDGTLQPVMDQSIQKFMETDKFYLRALSLSAGTFIAHGMNSYIVKHKKTEYPKEITVIIERTNTGFSAFSKAFKIGDHKVVGLNSVGSNLLEVKSRFYEVISGHLQYLKEEGIYYPGITDLKIKFVEQ